MTGAPVTRQTPKIVAGALRCWLNRLRLTVDRRTVIVDTGPDFRDQMIAAGVERIDAAVYTHPHADHIHGIDDLRGYVIAQRMRIPIYADDPTMARLREGFQLLLRNAGR